MCDFWIGFEGGWIHNRSRGSGWYFVRPVHERCGKKATKHTENVRMWGKLLLSARNPSPVFDPDFGGFELGTVCMYRDGIRSLLLP